MKKNILISIFLIGSIYILNAQNQLTSIINCENNQLFTIAENNERIFECQITGIQSVEEAENLKNKFLVFEGVIDVVYSNVNTSTYKFVIRSFIYTENNHIRKMLFTNSIEDAILNGKEVRTDLMYR